MDCLLVKLAQGTDAFLDFLNGSEEISQFALGTLVGIGQQQVKSEVKFMKVLWKVSKLTSESSLAMIKYAQVFRESVKTINRKNPLYMLEFYSESLKDFGEVLMESEISNEKYKQILVQQYIFLYNEVLDLYAECHEVIGLIRLGKKMKGILRDLDDSVLSFEDIEKLEKIVNEEDIVPGCFVLNQICLHLRSGKNQVLYNYLVSILVYLMETKAMTEHFKNISQYLQCFQDVFTKSSKEKLIVSYQILCERLNADPDQGLITTFGGIKKQPNLLKQNPPKANPVQVKPPFEFKDPIKKPNNPKQDLKKPIENPSKKPTSSQKNIKNPIKDPNQQIEEIIEEAIYLFEQNSKLDTGEYFEEFMELGLPSSSSNLFHKIDEIMSRGKPNKVKASFWNVMLAIIEKLPMITAVEMEGLRSKHGAMKGNIRDNKEKVSRQKENKVAYKEELIKTGKFQKDFKNGDREQKRAQKPVPPSESEKKLRVDADVLNASLSAMSQDALNLIRSEGLDVDSLRTINSQMIAIKAQLQKYSQSSTVRPIGSASIGTSLKSSEIDLLMTDKKCPCEDTLIKAFPSITKLTNGLYSLIVYPYKFKIYTENLFAVEASNLLKKYCLCDTRANELVIFIKLWARENNLNFISGFQWTLLVISFLQNIDPIFVTSLQEKDHQAKLVNGVDVWFDAEYSQTSQNCFSLGLLIYHFFSYYTENFRIVADVKKGKWHDAGERKYVVVHPFTAVEVEGDQSLMEIVQNCIRNTFNLLISGEKVNGLMKVNQ